MKQYLDLENFSIECHFKNKKEMKQWLDSLSPEKKELIKKGGCIEFNE